MALAVGAIVLGVMPVVGCGSDRSLGPTAPDRILVAAPSEQAVITATSTPLVITSLVSGTSCPTLQFTISSYVIKTDAATKYEGGSCTSLKAGTTLTTLNGSRPNTSELVLYATQITIQSSTTAPTPAPVSVTTDGTVTSLVGGTACPDLQFMFGTYVFKISPATAYSQASCADVKVGVHVYIAGTKRDGDSFVAVTGLGIKRDGAPGPTPTPTTPTTPTPAPAPVPVSFDATVTVSSVVATSACPYREFMVGDYRLTTSAMTRYDHGGCGDIAPGATLAIVATKGSRDTSVLVSSITFKDAEVTPPGTETVSSDLTVDRLVSETSCPALSFMVGPYTVTVNAATVFERGMCTDLKPGTALHLVATRQTDDHVLATRISFPE
jgi:hypothetical protein